MYYKMVVLNYILFVTLESVTEISEFFYGKA